MALYSGAAINWQIVIWGQGIVTATQLMVHYSNDYYDFEADQNNPTPSAWSGGSRVLPAGELPRRFALGAAIILAAIAIAGGLSLALIERPGPLTLPMVLVAVILSWQYSAPPLRLHSQGIGESFAVLILSLLTPMLGFYLQTRQIGMPAFLALIPLCFLQFNMLLSVDIPDAEGDALVNKRTLVVRLGRPASAKIYLLSLALAYLVLPALMLIGLPPLVGVCFALSCPVALWLAGQLMRSGGLQPAYWERLALLSIALLMSAATLELIAYVRLAIQY